MNQPPPTHNTGSELRFPSAASLRAAHEDLIKRRRAEGDTPEVLAEIQAFIQHGCETGRLLDGEDERRASQALLDFWSNTLLRLGQDPGDATLDDFDPLLAPELPDELCPYVGLDAFSENKTDLFFGRQRMVRTLVEKLESSRLLVVSGPSGSGKSSVVLAGLIPALKDGALPASEDWRYIPRMVPGSDPLANLARLLWTIGGDAETDQDAWIKDQIDHLRRDPGHLVRLADETGEAAVIGVIDQFEEVFTLCTDGEARQAFVANLLNLIQAPGSRHTVILTVRTDFESFVVLLPNFQSAFDQTVVRMTPLNAAELREAIEQPAALVGLKFESGLVDALLHDILGEPAALPLLQFTLLKLWDYRQRNLITWEAYKRLGGGRLALANSANAFYDDLIPEDKVTAQRILLRLVRPTEGLEVTSNRVRLETLLQIGEARDRLERVLEKFFAARLLRVTEGDVAADTQVEIAHEALVRNWPRLVEWLDAERDRMRKRMRLTAAAEQWNSLGRNDDALWRGALLDEAKQHHDLTDQEREFLEVSVQAQTEAAMAAERVRARELEQAQALAEAEKLRAEEQRNAASRYRRLTVALAMVSMIAIVAALIAVVLAQRAEEQRENAVQAKETSDAGLADLMASVGGQVALVDQLATVQADNASLALQVHTLEASSRRTPVPASTSTPTPRGQGRPTLIPTPGSATETILVEQAGVPTRTAMQPAPAGQPPGVILDFEAFGKWERGDQSNGSLAQTNDRKWTGNYAAKLAYDMPAVSENYVVFLRQPPLAIPGKPDALYLWVYGDGSGHFLNAWIQDAQGEVRQFTFGQVQHTDTWQQMTLPLDTATAWPQGHISGSDNGQLDYPIELYALVLDAVPDGAASKGAIYLDDLGTGAGAAAPDTTVTAAALAALRSQLQATQTAIAGDARLQQTPTPAVFVTGKWVPLRLRDEPSEESAVIASIMPQERARVVDFSRNPWFLAETAAGDRGWFDGRWVFYEGNASLLPTDLQFRVITDRSDIPFIDGRIVSHDGTTTSYPLLARPDPNDRTIVMMPVGQQLAVLAIRQGSSAYGSGDWYVVTVPDPRGSNTLWTGYVPVEIVSKQ